MRCDANSGCGMRNSECEFLITCLPWGSCHEVTEGVSTG